MSRVLLRLWLIVAFLSLSPSVLRQTVARHALAETEQAEINVRENYTLFTYAWHERQAPLTSAFTWKNSQRIASSRPVRVHTAGGGKPGNYQGRWAGSDTFHPYYSFQPERYSFCEQRCLAFASPRAYYVIALRRLLC